MNKSINKTLRCSLVVLATLWLGGCGLKGPLYMPPDEPTQDIMIPDRDVSQAVSEGDTSSSTTGTTVN
ncbi:LPS translocon maturation chaperone LptM [Leminorella richardii]|nr:lipoprotein [Leminorella richardii]